MRSICFALIIFLYIASLASAQQPPYLLDANDVLRITVVGQPDVSGDYLVPEDGNIALPWVGTITVKGKTLDALTELITIRLKDRLVEPRVAVTIRTPRQRNIYLDGKLRAPGVYALQPGWRISEALTAAGGATEDEDECRVIFVRHASGERIVIELPRVLNGDAAVNHVLAEGDAITVEATEMLPVFVMGAVREPGVVRLRQGGGIVEALALAGGVTLPVAELTAVLVRDRAEIPVDLHAALVASDPAANLLPRKNDLLMIKPVERIPIYVSGQVKVPGLHEIISSAGVIEALAQAGGSLLPAHDAIVSVQRGGATLLRAPLDEIVTGQAVLPESLRRGDLLQLEPRFSLTVTVAGKVRQPGTYSLPPGARLRDALALAGGVLEDGSSSRVTLVRQNGARTTLDLAVSKPVDDDAGNLEINAGDILIVPELSSRVSIIGYVNKPGYYLLPDGQQPRLADMLALAGGQEVRRGGIRQVAILRHVDGKEERLVCDLQQFFNKADVRQNPVVQANDIIFVPETNKVDWDIIFRGLSSLGIVFGQVF